MPYTRPSLLREFFFVLKTSGLSNAVSNLLTRYCVAGLRKPYNRSLYRLISKMEFALREPLPKNNHYDSSYESDYLKGYFTYWHTDQPVDITNNNDYFRYGFKDAVLEVEYGIELNANM